MKFTLGLSLILLLLVPVWATAAVIEPARVRLVDGDVLFRTPDADEWLPAAPNTPLDEGDAVWCPSGAKAEIQLPDGTMVRLDGASQLDLLANEQGFVHLHLAKGRLYARTAQTSSGKTLQIDADDTTVLPASRSRFRIDMLPNNQEDVTLFKGSAYVEGNGARTTVRAGEHLALEEGHSELLPLNPPDEWERWNMERDRSQSYSTKAENHLPEELRSYAGELASNGRWVRTSDYGMVWRPTVILADDWAPYYSGRWVWKGNDYVWVSYESWGWAPYHYGRWATVSGFGWCWIPPAAGDIYWGPGYVGWYRTGSHVGWTPLAPGEIFYGRGNYGRYSVNVINTTITSNTTTIVYRNRTVRGGFVLLPQTDFLHGRTAAQTSPGGTAATVTVSLGSPRIQPLRETRMPVVRRTSENTSMPRVEHRDVNELRQRFPRVTPLGRGQSTVQRQTPLVPAASNTSNAQPAHEGRRPTTNSLPERGDTTVKPLSATPAVQNQHATPAQEPAHQSEPARRTAVQSEKPAESTPQRREQERRKSTPAVVQPKKVWKVTIPEGGNEKENRERDHRERRER